MNAPKGCQVGRNVGGSFIVEIIKRYALQDVNRIMHLIVKTYTYKAKDAQCCGS